MCFGEHCRKATPTPKDGMVSSTVAASVLRSADCKSMKSNKRGWANEVGTIYEGFCCRIVDDDKDMNTANMCINICCRNVAEWGGYIGQHVFYLYGEFDVFR